MIDIDIYESDFSSENGISQFIFESSGKGNIYKAVQYSPFSTDIDGPILYNLGFGDYDSETKTISDSINSNNGDMWKVFNTVLTTIPIFFEMNPDAPLYIQGSDGSDDFARVCKETCNKNCTDLCKNRYRRIKTYSYFIDKNFKELSIKYQIFGLDGDSQNFIKYVPRNNYQALLVCKKK